MASRSLGTLTLDLIARIGGFEQGMDRAARTATNRMGQIERSTQSASSQIVSSLKSIGVAAVGYLGTRELIAYAETWTSVQNRLKQVTVSQQELANPWQEKLTLTRQGDHYQVNNPTPYYITLVDARSSKDAKTADDFEPLMVPPKGSLILGPRATALGATPYLTYINDYGGRPTLAFSCKGDNCAVDLKASPKHE